MVSIVLKQTLKHSTVSLNQIEVLLFFCNYVCLKTHSTTTRTH